jgi:hypothetical protein
MLVTPVQKLKRPSGHSSAAGGYNKTDRMPKSTLTERVNQHDREIAAIRKLMLAGMKMLVRLERNQERLQKAQERLEKAQERTEQTLERFIRSLERGSGNGHEKRRVQ